MVYSRPTSTVITDAHWQIIEKKSKMRKRKRKRQEILRWKMVPQKLSPDLFWPKEVYLSIPARKDNLKRNII